MIEQTPTALDPSAMLPMFIVWLAISIVALVLLLKRKTSKKIAIPILLVSFIVGGIILSAKPNPVLPIQQLIQGIAMGQAATKFLPFLLILAVLVLISLLIGRTFCGNACPLGAYQELISKINFKSSYKKQKKVKLALDIPKNIAKIIQWIAFAAFVTSIAIWGSAVIQLVNPFNGFALFTNPWTAALTIPIVWIFAIGITGIFIYRPYCRLLCPFGTLASFTSRFSQLKLRRTDACNDCGLCEKICPTHEAGRDSDKSECYLCHRCIEICPQNAIVFGTKAKIGQKSDQE